MKISNKTRGSVSVFLVIILVPCILVSSIFVDVGRVHLSSNIAKSSADLALNGLLTYYDYDLNDWYGLTASCQEINKYYATSEQYFTRMLKSQKLEDSEIILISDYAMDAFSDDEIDDLLKMEVMPAEDPMIQPVTGANLTNSTIIKTQTVEFMKYRGPITLATGVIAALQQGGFEDLLEQSKNGELTEKKEAYYRAEGDLLEKAFKCYLQIRKYSDSKINNIEINNTNLQKELEKLQKYRDTYKAIHKLYVMDLCNTEGMTEFERPQVEWDDYSYDEEDVCSSSEEKKDPTTGETIIDPDTGEAEVVYYVDSGTVSSIVTEMNNQVTAFNAAKSEVETKGGAIAYGADVYEIQYWAQLDKAINRGDDSFIEKMQTAGEKMADAYAQAEAMKDCDGDSDSAPDWDALDDAMAEVANLKKYLHPDTASEEGDTYLTLVNRLEDISSLQANKDKIDPQKVKVDGKKISTAIEDISKELEKTIEDLDKCINILTIAIDGNDDVPSLDTLSTTAGKYNTDLTNWTNEANSTQTNMAEKDRELIAGTAKEADGTLSEDNLSESCKNITQESVTELKNRLSGIKKQLENIKTALESLKYGEAQLKGINNYSTFKDKANTKVDVDNIPLKTTELESYASQRFQELFAAYDKLDSPSSYILTADTNNVELNPGNENAEGSSYKVPDLYLHLHKEYGDDLDKETAVENAKSQQKTAEDEAKKKAESAKSRTAGSTNNITRSFSPEGGKFNILEGLLDSVTTLVKNLVEGNAVSMRDNLYAGTYIMEMFSYGTFENEGKRELALKEAEADGTELKLNLKNYDEKYKEVAGDSSKTADENKGTWLSEDPTDTYNKSLTNHLINEKNNYAYQCEVEYILYGETNEKNIKSAYSDIYTIRYALNLVSAFQNFWTGTNKTAKAINGVAQGIAAATGYIIPPPVTKVIILPILTIFETSRDLDRLEAGFKVELYKSDADDWQISLDGEMGMGEIIGKLSGQDGGSGTGPDEDAEKGLQYSDYITLFVLLGLTGENTSEAMYLRMAEVVEANMKHLTGDNGYTFSKSHVFFTLDAQIRTRPTMVTLPIFSEYSNDMNTKTDWCTFNIFVKRGY